jgi:hypothetical protein
MPILFCEPIDLENDLEKIFGTYDLILLEQLMFSYVCWTSHWNYYNLDVTIEPIVLTEVECIILDSDTYHLAYTKFPCTLTLPRWPGHTWVHFYR